MPAKNGLTTQSQITTAVREVDFVTRFTRNWNALRDLMGIMRPIRKNPGTKLVSYKAEVDGGLQGGTSVAEGDEIPLTRLKVSPVAYEDIDIAKYGRSVSVEAITKYGAQIAIEKCDEAFLNAIQSKILSDFYAFLATGTLTGAETTWQRAMAIAKGKVLDKFAAMNKDVTEVVGFANILDAYGYLGDNLVSVQTQFGLSYLKDFLGYRTVFLLPDVYVPAGKVYAVPVENIDLYYIDPSDADIGKAGLSYRVEGETNLIGVHVAGDYSRATGDMYALCGMKLWAEYLDGIAVISFAAAPMLGKLTVASAQGSETGATKLTVTEAKLDAADKYKYKVGEAAETVVYGQNVQNWALWDGEADIKAATGQTLTLVECTSDFKAVAAGTCTVDAKAGD